MTTAEQILATVPDGHKSGNCFQVHLHKLQLEPEYTLVHGVAVGNGPIEGIEHNHCWLEFAVEVGGCEFVMVHDCSNGKNVTMPAALYYLAGLINPETCVRYTLKEAATLANQTGHYGPWHELPDHVV